MGNKTVFPYIPNSVPEIQREMLDYVGAKDVMDLYLSLHQPFSQMPDAERSRISVFMAGGTVAFLREWFSSGMEKSSAETYAELRDIVGCCLSGFQRM